MIILDIDNCIADDAWRIPRIQWNLTDNMRRYETYHMLAPFDRAENFALHVGLDCLVLTSRPLVYREPTLEWLRRIAGVKVKHLLMRNNDDHRSSLDVKRGQVRDLVAHYGVRLENLMGAYDDRPEIVGMYTAAGVPRARVLCIHRVSAYLEDQPA